MCYLLRRFLQDMILSKHLGVAASGSAKVSQTAVDILEAGGNAFDAALGALCTASIAEPLLASLGGGGFLLALPEGGKPRVYDFFCQTPGRRRPEEDIDFMHIDATDFPDPDDLLNLSYPEILELARTQHLDVVRLVEGGALANLVAHAGHRELRP